MQIELLPSIRYSTVLGACVPQSFKSGRGWGSGGIESIRHRRPFGPESHFVTYLQIDSFSVTETVIEELGDIGTFNNSITFRSIGSGDGDQTQIKSNTKMLIGNDGMEMPKMTIKFKIVLICSI